MRQGKKIPAKFWNTTFLEALKDSIGNISSACRIVGVTPQSYYLQRYKNPSFDKKVEEIQKRICLPLLEDIARSKATHDNDKMLMFMLRNLGGDKWNQDVIHVQLARIEAEIRKVERINEENERARKEYLGEQRKPTKAELYASAAYGKALIEYLAEHPEDANK